MSDPLSLSASIAGILNLGELVFRNLYKYYRSAAGAKDEIKNIADQVNDLMSVVRILEALASAFEAEGDSFNPALRNHHLHRCNDILKRIEKRIKKPLENFSSQNRIDSALRRLKWPFSRSEAKELLADLSQNKQSISLAIGADSLQLLQEALTKMDDVKVDTSKLASIAEITQINTQILVDARKQEVLNFFMPVDPKSRLDTSIRLRHPTSGLWLTESSEFLRWLDVPGSNLWLSGIPGAGKTVLAGALVQETLKRSYSRPNVGVGYFFCDYKQSNTWKPKYILGALASQLARQKNEAYECLYQYYKQLHPSGRLEIPLDVSELRATITKMACLFSETFFIVDGLDECGTESQTNDVMEILKALADCATKESLAFLSRDHFNIRIHLENDFHHISIAAHSEDVRDYVSAELRRRIRGRQLRFASREIETEIQDALVSRANGMFRWVVCQLDYLCSCAHDEERREALKSLPPDLPESYRRLLDRLDGYSHNVRSVVQMCLYFIAVADPPLSIPELKQAVSTPVILGSTLTADNTVSEEDISTWCSSLIRKANDNSHFEFAHFSVLEFLHDREALTGKPHQHSLEAYHIDKEAGRKLLASQCLKFLQLDNFNRQPVSDVDFYLDNNFPLYDYAAKKLVKLVTLGFKDSALLELAVSFFHTSRLNCFQFWVFYILCDKETFPELLNCDPPVADCYTIISSPNFQPLHMAAALNSLELCQRLLENGASISSRFKGWNVLDMATFRGFTLFPEFIQKPYMWYDSGLGRQVSKNRQATIKFLALQGTKISSDLIAQVFKTQFFSLSMYSIVCYQDFSMMVTALEANIFPQDGDLKKLEQSFFPRLERALRDMDIKSRIRLERSSQMLFDWLGQATDKGLSWHPKLQQMVCQQSTRLGFRSLKSNPQLKVSQKVVEEPESPSDKSEIAIKAIAAVSEQDINQLAECLSDEHLRRDKIYEGLRADMLHAAVNKGDNKAVKLLLQHEWDANMKDHNGIPALQKAPRDSIKETMSLFVTFGFPLSSQNSAGRTILHNAVRGLNTFEYTKSDMGSLLSDMDSVSRSETTKALLTRDNNGNTPLTEALSRNHFRSYDYKWKEACAISLLKYCRNIPKFLNSHPHLIGASARFGSGKVIAELIEQGAPLDSVGIDGWTPLHAIGPEILPGAVKRLKSLYPAACETVHRQKVPYQSFLLTVLNNLSSNSDGLESVLEELITPAIYPGVWMSICRSVCCHLRSTEFNKRVCLRVVLFGIDHGALAAYEASCRTSGLLPLFDAFIEGRGSDEMDSIVIDNLISQTAYWDRAKQSDKAIRFVKYAIKIGNATAVYKLLESGLDVHQREDGNSVIEMICSEGEIYRQHLSPGWERLLGCVLENSDSTRLRECTPISGLSLLHRLVGANKIAMGWLLQELLRRGLDINGKSQQKHPISALMFHIKCGSFATASLLFASGAKVFPGDRHTYLKCIAKYIRGGDIDRKLQSGLPLHKQSGPFFSIWSTTFAYRLQVEEEDIEFTGLTLFDLCTAFGRKRCVSFLLDGGFITNVNTRTRDGYTPLHFACMNGDLDTILLLTTRNADVNARSIDGSTPLHMAARNGHHIAAQALLRHGAANYVDNLNLSPAMYARELMFDEILGCLEDTFGQESCASSSPGSWTPENSKTFSKRFEKAILRSNIFECERLFLCGCPIETSFSSKPFYSPLAAAVIHGKYQAVQWLVDKGASLTRAFNTQKGTRSILELAICNKELNLVLSTLVDTYLAEGGNLIDGSDFPLHRAIESGNTEGVRILIYRVEANAVQIAKSCGIKPGQVVPTFINRRSYKDRIPLPLDMAIMKNDKVSVSFFFHKGRCTKKLDTSIYSLSPDMAEHLSSLGCLKYMLYEFFLSTKFSQFRRLRIIQSFGGKIEEYFRHSSNLLTQICGDPCSMSMEYDDRSPIGCVFPSVDDLSRAIPTTTSCDLLRMDCLGLSLMHLALLTADTIDLALASRHQIEQTTPFPWHIQYSTYSNGEFAFLQSKFKLLLRLLSRETHAHIANLEPDRGWSPLCLAAMLGWMDMLENCLKLGAILDFDGCPFGSALIAASIRGQCQAVRVLVRAGASLSAMTRNGLMNAVTLTESKEVRQYLLVGRFNEIPRIMAASSFDTEAKTQVECRPWSGPAFARLRLIGKQKRFIDDSARDYACVLSDFRRSWSGKVVSSSGGLVFPEDIRLQIETMRLRLMRDKGYSLDL